MADAASLSDTQSAAAATDTAFAAIRSAFPRDLLCNALVSRNAVIVRGAVPVEAGGLPDLHDIELAIAQLAFPADDVRVFGGRNQVDLEHFRVARKGMINPPVLAMMTHSDSTIAFNRVERRIVSAHRISMLAEEWLGDPVTIAMLATFGSDSGLPVHHDEETVIAVQIAGRKRWSLYGEPVRPGMPCYSEPTEEEPRQQFTLDPGDALFLPAGQRHQCRAEGSSLHLALVVEHFHGGVACDQLKELLEADTQMLDPAPALLGQEADLAKFEQYRRRLHELVDSIDISRLVDQKRKSRRAAKPVRFAWRGET